jgi:DNA polymerase/3'-5' exonuclease PolX
MDEEKLSSTNDEIATVLDEISAYYSLDEDSGRALAFSKAAANVKNTDEQIPSGEWAKRHIMGVAESIGAVIDEILSGNVPARLISLRGKYGHQKPILDHFTSFYGIGRVKSLELYGLLKAGRIKTRQDMIRYGHLSEIQKKGIIYHDHLSQKISRFEMEMIRERIDHEMEGLGYGVGRSFRHAITGSYRRGSVTSNDVDLLVEAVPGLNMYGVVESLQGMIVETFKKGEHFFEGVIRISPHLYAHKMDILLVTSDHWSGALLHFTGSKSFNVALARLASSQGHSLGRYGLKLSGDSDVYPADDEKEIFDILGVEYIPPEKRTKDFLPFKSI